MNCYGGWGGYMQGHRCTRRLEPPSIENGKLGVTRFSERQLTASGHHIAASRIPHECQYAAIDQNLLKLSNRTIDRMSVILPREKWATWLGEREADADELRWMILRPYSADLMRAYPVGQAVGNVRNNEPALLDEISIAA